MAAALAKAERERRAAREQLAGEADRRQPSTLQQMTLEQLDLAIALLEGRGQHSPQRTIHETRKALKRTRALVRLQRRALGERRFQRENAALRDAARCLAGARDAEVVPEALEALLKRHPKRLAGSPAIAKLRARLQQERERAGAHTPAGEHARTQALEQLRAARGRVAQWKPRGSDRATARGGLRRIYRQGRVRGRVARRAQSSEALHQWRKRTKDVRYLAEMLGRRETAAALSKKRRKHLREIARRADRLGETLGEEHDLALLGERVRAHRKCFKGEKATRRALERAIASRRKQLRKRAWHLGKRLYRRKPARFVRSALGS